jgi:hypothetical protein
MQLEWWAQATSLSGPQVYTMLLSSLEIMRMSRMFVFVMLEPKERETQFMVLTKKNMVLRFKNTIDTIHIESFNSSYHHFMEQKNLVKRSIILLVVSWRHYG